MKTKPLTSMTIRSRIKLSGADIADASTSHVTMRGRIVQANSVQDQDWLMLNHGHKYHLLDATQHDVVGSGIADVGKKPYVVSDISHALSRICRYTGNVKEFYSVASHSLLVAQIAHKMHGPAAALIALAHDAGEIVVSDIPGPLKRILPPETRQIIAAIEDRAVRFFLGIMCIPEEVYDDPEVQRVVKYADKAALAIEARDVVWKRDDWKPERPPGPIYAFRARIEPPKVAHRRFVIQFRSYMDMWLREKITKTPSYFAQRYDRWSRTIDEVDAAAAAHRIHPEAAAHASVRLRLRESIETAYVNKKLRAIDDRAADVTQAAVTRLVEARKLKSRGKRNKRAQLQVPKKVAADRLIKAAKEVGVMLRIQLEHTKNK
jgi:hypothetical protein